MVICLERGADLHMAQLMPLPLAVSCFSKIQIGFTFLVPAHPGIPGQRAVKRVCAKTNESVCMCAYLFSVPYAQPVFSRSGPNLARGILMVIKRFLQKDGETVISDSQSAIV